MKKYLDLAIANETIKTTDIKGKDYAEVNHLEEKIEDIEQDIQDNYRPIPVAEQVDISDGDFI